MSTLTVRNVERGLHCSPVGSGNSGVGSRSKILFDSWRVGMQMTEAVSGVVLGFLCSSPPRRSSSPSLKGVAVDASRDCHALFAALSAARRSWCDGRCVAHVSTLRTCCSDVSQLESTRVMNSASLLRHDFNLLSQEAKLIFQNGRFDCTDAFDGESRHTATLLHARSSREAPATDRKSVV